MSLTRTDRAQRALGLASEEARRFNHGHFGTEHILLGLIKENSGIAAYALKSLGVDLHEVRHEVAKLVPSEPEMVTAVKLPQTPPAKKAIEYAMEEARNLNHNYVGTEHLLLGLLREVDGVAAQVLMNLGLTLEQVRNSVLEILGGSFPPQADPAPATSNPPATDPYSVVYQILGDFCEDFGGTKDDVALLLSILERPFKPSAPFDIDVLKSYYGQCSLREPFLSAARSAIIEPRQMIPRQQSPNG